MTGTGVQNDPYIPTTLTEFITAVGTSGAYVALTQDINAADDPEYTGELTESIAWSAAEVDGRDFSLVGVTVAAGYSFFSTSFATTVIDFRVRDCCLKKGNIDFIIWDCANGYMDMYRCKISMKVDGEAGSTAYLSYNVGFTDCAIEIEYTGESSPRASADSVFDKAQFTRSTVVVRGLNTEVTTRLLARCSVSRSAFVIYDPSGNINIVYGADGAQSTQYSYICFMGTVNGTINANWDATTCLVASEMDTEIGLEDGWTRATLDQLKDKDWLTSVGFLP